MAKVYIYVVDRDFGFAPNPFHGFCSLATCKPRIRNAARIGDWVIGVGGTALQATGKCLFAMKVTKKISYNEYFSGSEYKDKKPVRHGSKKMMVGDNIYYHDPQTNLWHQSHSHHSNEDGSLNIYNRDRDTQSSYVLLSKHFFYFGRKALEIPQQLFGDINYKNGRNHRTYSFEEASKLITWIIEENKGNLNLVLSDPFNFDQSQAHYSVQTNRITGK
jgi:hypothetical protein